MNFDSIILNTVRILEDLSPQVYKEHNDIVVILEKAKLVDGVRRLRDHKHLSLKQLIDVTAVDYLGRKKRFDLVYLLLSMQHNFRVRVKVQIDEDEKISSLCHIFSAANWYEREVWDMFGIAFENHPDLRRILTDYEFEGHPLRKDFPLTGYKEVHYSQEQQKVIYEDVDLPLAYREFDFLSPWYGPTLDDKKASSS